jgi:hypothetical protein
LWDRIQELKRASAQRDEKTSARTQQTIATILTTLQQLAKLPGPDLSNWCAIEIPAPQNEAEAASSALARETLSRLSSADYDQLLQATDLMYQMEELEKKIASKKAEQARIPGGADGDA